MAARSLFRTMLREAAQVDQYNFRNYAIRRVREDFRRNAALSGSEAATALQEGKDALEVLRRQRIVGQRAPRGAVRHGRRGLAGLRGRRRGLVDRPGRRRGR